MKTVLFEGNSDLSSMLIELINTKILLEGCDDVILDHELPASIELSNGLSTSLSKVKMSLNWMDCEQIWRKIV